MRVVQLRGKVLVERLERIAQPQMNPEHVLQRARDEEVLLLQPKLLALLQPVVRIQHFREVLRLDLPLHRAAVVAFVERGEIERLGRFGLPQPEQTG
jgi:hypothetical protein